MMLPILALSEKFKQPINIEGLMELFSKEVGLIVPLSEVILLVMVINGFALFKKPRLIMAISYLFCLKWVFWSNYTQILQQSNAVTMTSTFIFVGCGILTGVLFFLNRFSAND